MCVCVIAWMQMQVQKLKWEYDLTSPPQKPNKSFNSLINQFGSSVAVFIMTSASSESNSVVKFGLSTFIRAHIKMFV